MIIAAVGLLFVALILFVLVSELSVMEPQEDALDAMPGRDPGFWVGIWCAVVFASMFLDMLLISVVIPQMPQMTVNFKVPGYMTGLLFSAKPIGQILMSPITAKVVRSFGPRAVCCVASAVMIITTAIYASSGSDFHLALAARSMQGIGSSGIWVGGQTGLTTLQHKREGMLLSTATMGAALGLLCGPAIGGWLAAPDMFGFHGSFWALSIVAALISFANIGFYFLALPETLALRAGRWYSSYARKDMRGGRGFTAGNLLMWLILFATFSANMTIGMLEPVAPVIAVQDFGFQRTETGRLGLAWCVMPLGYILSTPVAGYLSDRYEKNWTLAAGMAMFIAGLILLKCLPHQLLQYELDVGGWH